jgi:hypothetical protein
VYVRLRGWGFWSLTAITMVNIAKENHEGFTNREFDRAKQACRALALRGYPSPKDFKKMVRSNMIDNCPVSKIDITNADIFL